MSWYYLYGNGHRNATKTLTDSIVGGTKKSPA